ncbi:MAG: acyltransferase [Clostridia bacterium]|nr:acyltransferase [Clostridia bacterium]
MEEGSVNTESIKKYSCRRNTAFLARLTQKIRKRWYERVELPYLKSQLGGCGDHVSISKGAYFCGKSNIYFSDHVYLGPNALIYSVHARVVFGSHVIVGPNLTVMSGDHRFDLVGRYIDSIGEDEKLSENDRDVIIGDDVWIGAGVSIFKGVTVGRGSVIAGAATVVKDVPPYSVYIAKDKIYPRFDAEQIEEHERILCKDRHNTPK